MADAPLRLLSILFVLGALLLSGLVIVVLAQLVLGSVLLWLPQDLTQSYLALACILVLLLLCSAPVYWLLMSELFPNQVRGLLTGVAVALQWLCNATVAFSFPVALKAIDNFTFYVFAAINPGPLLFFYFCLPETRGKSLEESEQHLKKKPCYLDS